MCVQKSIFATLNPYIIFLDLFLFLRTYTCIVYFFFSGKTVSMPSEGSSPHQLERRKKSLCDVDAGEGGSGSCPPRRHSKRIVHRTYPWGHMHIKTEIEAENPIDTSDDESVEDETYRMSPVPPLKTTSRMRLRAMIVGWGMKLKKKKGWLRGFSTLDLEEGLLSTLAQPSIACTSPWAIMSQVTKEKGQQSK
jgi:hypothetical protein